jgi:hypothetical protein
LGFLGFVQEQGVGVDSGSREGPDFQVAVVVEPDGPVVGVLKVRPDFAGEGSVVIKACVADAGWATFLRREANRGRGSRHGNGASEADAAQLRAAAGGVGGKHEVGPVHSGMTSIEGAGWATRAGAHGSAVDSGIGSPRWAGAEMTAKTQQAHLPAARREAVDPCRRYLTSHLTQLRHDVALDNGWPITTGAVEGTCRHLIGDRLDITSARWELHGAEAVPNSVP